MDNTFLTLTEVSETKDNVYPIIVRVRPEAHELPHSDSLPSDTEMLLESPRCLQYALVRTATCYNDQEKREEKGHSFVKDHDDYVGEEHLIPLCYPGALKIVKKQGQLDEYTTIKQVIQDLPRYVRIEQETLYTPPGRNHPTSSLSTGARLEIKNVYEVDGITHLQCKSIKTSREYIFRDVTEIKCSSIDDPAEHTLLNLERGSFLLPKVIQFQNVWPDDIVLKDDDEARNVLALTSGPMTLLKTSVKINVFVAWLRSETCSMGKRIVALIPEKGWDNKIFEVKQFEDLENKEEFIKTRFGEGIESNFLATALYTIAPNEAGVVWMRIPKTEEAKEYEVPIPENKKIPYLQLHEELPLPTRMVKRNDSYVLRKIKEKATIGFGKAHDQLLRMTKRKHMNTHEEHRELERSTSPLNNLPMQWHMDTCNSDGIHVGLSSKGEATGIEEKNLDFPKLSQRNENRQLPDLPPYSNINVTGDDDKHLYDLVVERKDENPDDGPHILQHQSNVSLQNQKPDFYSYTVEELEECLKSCGLNKFALDCSSYQLDGEFFRNFDMKELKSEPFNLDNIEVIKVTKIIECGWRPKR